MTQRILPPHYQPPQPKPYPDGLLGLLQQLNDKLDTTNQLLQYQSQVQALGFAQQFATQQGNTATPTNLSNPKVFTLSPDQTNPSTVPVQISATSYPVQKASITATETDSLQHSLAIGTSNAVRLTSGVSILSTYSTNLGSPPYLIENNDLMNYWFVADLNTAVLVVDVQDSNFSPQITSLTPVFSGPGDNTNLQNIINSGSAVKVGGQQLVLPPLPQVRTVEPLSIQERRGARQGNQP
jgi:hypothetical protein